MTRSDAPQIFSEHQKVFIGYGEVFRNGHTTHTTLWYRPAGRDLSMKSQKVKNPPDGRYGWGPLEWCGWGMPIQNQSTIHKKHFWLLRRSVARSQRSVYIGSKCIHKIMNFCVRAKISTKCWRGKPPKNNFTSGTNFFLFFRKKIKKIGHGSSENETFKTPWFLGGVLPNQSMSLWKK